MSKSTTIPQDRLNRVIELFKMYGYRSPSMLDIANHLAISKKTLYLYASNKEDLICITIQSVGEDVLQKCRELQQGEQNIRAWMQLLVSFHQDFSYVSCQDLSIFYPRAEEEYHKVRTALRRAFQKEMKGYKKQGRLPKHLRMKFLAASIDHQIEQIVHEQFTMPGETVSALLQKTIACYLLLFQ